MIRILVSLFFLQKKLSMGIILIRVKGQRSLDKVKSMKKLLMGYRDKLLKTLYCPY